MELFHYGPLRRRLSVVAGVLGGTHCESVWSRFGTSMVMLRPFSTYDTRAVQLYRTCTRPPTVLQQYGATLLRYGR